MRGVSLGLSILPDLSPKNWLEIVLLFFALYLFLRFLRRTIAGGIFIGPAMLSWVVILGLFLLLELRHGIARLGNIGFLRRLVGSKSARPEQMKPVDEIIRACRQFAERRVGALIAVERNIDLGTYMDTGVPMDAIIRAETLDTIFSTHTVLHDGALLIRGARIAAAGCLLPLTERPQLAREYGTRHRAAIGLSEQSDAVVLVVSEERGDVHKAERGEMEEVNDWEWLRAYLSIVFAEKTGLVPRENE